MFSPLTFSAMLMLSSIASAAMLDSSDSTWLNGDDDTLVSNTDWTSNPAVVPPSPSALDMSLFDSGQLPNEISLSSSTMNNGIDATSDELLWGLGGGSSDIGILPWSGANDDNSNELDNLFLDDSLELAGCSTSSGEQSLSRLDNTSAKSRLRRRDDSNRCANPAVTPHTNSQSSSASDDADLDLIKQLFSNPEFLDVATRAKQNQNNNFVCFVLTDGLLPFGVCSTGLFKDEIPLGGPIQVHETMVTLWSLRNALFLPGYTLTCPNSPPRVFHCCNQYLAGTAQGCVRYRDINFAFLTPNRGPD